VANLVINDLTIELKLNVEQMEAVCGGIKWLCSARHTRNIMSTHLMARRARNEGDKIKGFFQGWQEKANQVDQQLTSLLRIMKDLGRVGVGGSDLGAS
jgi:hypothetical protein